MEQYIEQESTAGDREMALEWPFIYFEIHF